MNEIDDIILDLREENDYNTFPDVFISRDKFLPELLSMKNKDIKMIITHHFDERNGIVMLIYYIKKDLIIFFNFMR